MSNFNSYEYFDLKMILDIRLLGKERVARATTPQLELMIKNKGTASLQNTYKYFHTSNY